MPLLPILLVAAVMMVDSGLTPIGTGWQFSRAAVASWSLMPLGVIVLGAAGMLMACDRRLQTGRSTKPFLMADRIGRWSRMAIVLHHIAAVLVFGWLGVVRSVVGNPILLDEVFAILPAFAALMGIWWAHYPIDRRMHDALLIRTLDEGRTLYPPLSRFGYVVLQTRLQLLLVLIPILAIAGLSETITRAGAWLDPARAYTWIFAVAKIGVAAAVFTGAPWLARLVLDVRAMPQGTLRHALQEVANLHGVAIRQILVWRTNGSLFNAAVMGLTGRLRYVLMTDALLDSMRQEQVVAVMAHEIGHVRRHHMPWMVICLFGSMGVAATATYPIAWLVQESGWFRSSASVDAIGLAMTLVQLVLALIIFGWVCRRFERQADTFAVQHLSRFPIRDDSMEMRGDGLVAARESLKTTKDHGTTVTAAAAHIMCEALDSIARLNAIEHHRPSWRHDSIAWRMEYLLTLVGQPLTQLAIDRTVLRIKLAAMIAVVGAVAATVIDYVVNGGVPT